MSDRKINIDFGGLCLVIFFLVLIILFVGEPDLHDAIIKWALK